MVVARKPSKISFLNLFPAGVIDQDYRGNVGVIMFNFGEEEFKGLYIHTGSCILARPGAIRSDPRGGCGTNRLPFGSLESPARTI